MGALITQTEGWAWNSLWHNKRDIKIYELDTVMHGAMCSYRELQAERVEGVRKRVLFLRFLSSGICIFLDYLMSLTSFGHFSPCTAYWFKTSWLIHLRCLFLFWGWLYFSDCGPLCLYLALLRVYLLQEVDLNCSL